MKHMCSSHENAEVIRCDNEGLLSILKCVSRSLQSLIQGVPKVNFSPWMTAHDWSEYEQ